MLIHFKNKLEGIDWIAAYAEDEGQFEVLREQLLFNFIRSGKYFLDLSGPIAEVVLLKNDNER